MEREKKTESPMLKLARFIVDKRKAFYLIFLASFLFCAVSISKVHVNDDITTYLPAHTDQGQHRPDIEAGGDLWIHLGGGVPESGPGQLET